MQYNTVRTNHNRYRCAFSLIGYKGCAHGGAVMSMGKRQTMVRLEARLSLDSDGGTVIAERCEDHTNISDVIIDAAAADGASADGTPGLASAGLASADSKGAVAAASEGARSEEHV